MSEVPEAHDSPTAETSIVKENVGATEDAISEDTIKSGAAKEEPGTEALNGDETPDKYNTSICKPSEDGVSQNEASADGSCKGEAPNDKVASKNEEALKDEISEDDLILNDEPTPADVPVQSTSVDQDDENTEKSSSPNITQGNNEALSEDVEMEDTKGTEDVRESENIVDVTDPSINALSELPVPENKSKIRRKSSGVPEHRTKKLSKKAAKPKTTHIDAKPGDYFYVRLKGYPLWPAIVCDETMLPYTLLKSRPVTAARPDGTYREEFMDGGPKAKDRSFPVMYLFTNEFGWIPNYDLLEIDFEEIGNTTGTMRKDLAMARQLAAKKHDLDYFKDILKSFMETKEAELLEAEKSKEEKRSLKEKKKDNEKKKTPRKPKKSKATACDDDIADLDIPDAKLEVENAEISPLNQNSKRPADEPLEGPLKKKTTIKLTTKTNIGKLNPKSPKNTPKKQKAEKVVKTKKQKAIEPPNIELPMEPQLTLEELRVKKEKEIFFLRHKLQKGLLNKDQELKVEEMQNMSEFLEKLEGYTDLEVSIIRLTKINKVLKAILKISNIPMEEEYQFKPRSHNLLEKWNKILADDAGKPSGSTFLDPTNSEAKVDSEVTDPPTSKIPKVLDGDKTLSQNKTSAEETTKTTSRGASPDGIIQAADEHISPSDDALKEIAVDSEV